MQVRFFTIPIQGGEAAVEDLNRFLASQRILAIERNFVQDGSNSAWALCVSFEPAGNAAGRPPPGLGRRGVKIDYREILNEMDFALAAAFHRAALGKSRREEVQAFCLHLDQSLADLRRAILDGTVELGHMRRFRISDPKPRVIHAPCFRERVLHHALIARIGPVLDRTLVADSYACRLGKGSLAAVERVQQHLRRFPWYAQIDIRAYFATIDHVILLDLLARRFKDPGLLALLGRIVAAHHGDSGKGLPIGALTSQTFANYYLGGLDRVLLEQCRVRGLVRYMDDLLWWGEDRTAVERALDAARAFTEQRLALTIKEPARIGRSRDGVAFCGFRILPDRLLLSRRRKRRYQQSRRQGEQAFLEGAIGPLTLQAGYASAVAITLPADAAGWRRRQLVRQPLVGALAEL